MCSEIRRGKIVFSLANAMNLSSRPKGFQSRNHDLFRSDLPPSRISQDESRNPLFTGIGDVKNDRKVDRGLPLTKVRCGVDVEGKVARSKRPGRDALGLRWVARAFGRGAEWLTPGWDARFREN